MHVHAHEHTHTHTYEVQGIIRNAEKIRNIGRLFIFCYQIPVAKPCPPYSVSET